MKARRIGKFALHYVEMVIAMFVGMMLLYPLWSLAVAGADASSVLHAVEVDALVMATTMSVPMAAWMRFRGHTWAPTLEMCAAMYAGFVAAIPFHWAGALGEHGVMMAGHIAMFALMVVAMLWRWDEYAGHGHQHGAAAHEAAVGLPAS